MNWILLFLAGLAEVSWAVAMKFSEGFTKLVPSIVTIIGYIISLVLLSLAVKQLPLGTAYAIWTGIGIVGTTVLGVLFFNETLSLMQVICVIMIVVGAVGLKIME